MICLNLIDICQLTLYDSLMTPCTGIHPTFYNIPSLGALYIAQENTSKRLAAPLVKQMVK